MSYRVLGLDPSLRNLGWQVRTYGDEPGIGVRVAGGTVRDHDAHAPLERRLLHVAAQAHALVRLHRPALVVLEGPLVHGHNRSPTGLALHVLIVRPWVLPDAITGLPGPFPGLRHVVVLNPARLASLVREDTKPTAATLKARYRRDTGEAHQLSEHEVDAYFLAHFGVRFLRTLVLGDWPRAILTAVEQDVFLFGEKKNRSGDSECHALWAQRDFQWWETAYVPKTESRDAAGTV